MITISSASWAGNGKLVEVRILFQEARLVVEGGSTARILFTPVVTEGTSPIEPIVLVPSSSLQVHRLAPGLFQVVARACDSLFWRFDAPGNGVQVVEFGIPGSDGGIENDPSWMELTPTEADAARGGNFEARIRDLELVFRPEEATTIVEGGELQLALDDEWEFRQVGPFHFHLRRAAGWEDHYLAVDAGGKAVGLVRPGSTFGVVGETWQQLSAPVQSIRVGGRYERLARTPKLLEPAEGAVVDNGCYGYRDPIDRRVWTFRWTPVDGAERYELSLAPPSRPTLGKIYETRHPFLVLVKKGAISGDHNRYAWHWKVRAVREGRPLPFSETRTFDVEPGNADLVPRPWMMEDPPRPERTGKGGRKPKPAKAPVLRTPEEGAVLDNGRADGLDILTWEFAWKPVRGCKEYEWIVWRYEDSAPLLRERVKGTKFTFSSSEYRLFGLKRRVLYWRVRALDRNGPGCWSRRRWFTVEPMDSDPPDAASDSARDASSPDVPVLLRPKPGARLENGIPTRKGTHRHTWTFKWRKVRGAKAYDIEYGLRGRTRPRVERVEKTSFKVVGTAYHFHPCDWYWRVRAIRDGVPLRWSLKRPFDLLEPE